MSVIKDNKKRIIDISLLIVVLIILFTVLEDLKSVIAPFIYGTILAYILNPAVKKMERGKIERIWAILIIFFAFTLLLVVFFSTIVPQLSNDIGGLVKDLPNISNTISEMSHRFESGEYPLIPDNLSDYFDIEEELKEINKYLGSFLRGIIDKLIKSTGTIIDIVMTPVIAFYLLKDKEKIIGKIKNTTPDTYRDGLEAFYRDIDKALGGFIKGQLLVALIVAFLTGVGCFFIGVPHSLTIGLVAGITNIIPYFGPWIGGILPVILAFINEPISGLWVIILIVVVQQIESVFISPQIMSYSVGIHPLLVMFSVLFFGKMFGILGMVIGVPIMSASIILSKHLIILRAKLNNS